MRRLAIVVAAFLRRSLLEQTVQWTPAVLQMIGFGVGILSQAFLGRLVDAAPNAQLGAYAGHYTAFLLLGMAMLDLQTAVVSGLAHRIREAQRSGSLESLMATATPTSMVLFGLVVSDVLWALVRLLVYAAFGVALFGLQLERASLLGVALVLPAALCGFAALALLGATLTMFLRRGDPLTFLVGGLSLVAGGVLYPRTILPGPLAWLGQLLPITSALEALRASIVYGAGPIALAAPLGRLLLFVVAVAPFGLWSFSRALARARVDGSLTCY